MNSTPMFLISSTLDSGMCGSSGTASILFNMLVPMKKLMCFFVKLMKVGLSMFCSKCVK